MTEKIKIGLQLIILLLAGLFLTLFLKYDQNNLSLYNFQLNNLGNLLNVFITALAILGIILNIFEENSSVKKIFLLSYFLLIISLLNLSIVFLTQSITADFFNNYLFGFSIKKILITVNYCASSFLQLYIGILLYRNLRKSSVFNYFTSLIISFAVVSLLFVFAFIYSFLGDSNLQITQVTNKKDVTVVLGAAVYSGNMPSPIFEGRIKKAEELMKKNQTKFIQLTGGKAPGEISEAKCAYNYLIVKGIKPSSLLFEEATTTTSEQIRYIKNILINKNKFVNIVIITDQFHIVRVLEMCKFFDINAKGIASDYDLSFGRLIYYRLRDSIGLLLFWFFGI